MSKRKRSRHGSAGMQPRAREPGAMAPAESKPPASITKVRLVILLQRATIAWLSLPLVIFLLGYLRWELAAAATVSLSAALWFYFRDSGELPRDNKTIPLAANISHAHIAVCLLAALFFTSLFGAGGWGYQTVDWFKHNAMLTHLSLQEWPVFVPEKADGGGAQLPLVYYIGYYLPAALIGKVFGFTAANHALFLWTAFGVFLSLLWVFAFTRTSAKWIILVFFFFSDLDVIGAFITDRGDFRRHLEWWIAPEYGEFQLAANAVGLAWVPQHIISAWLLTSLLLRDIAAGQAVRRGLLLIALGVLVSVMVSFGIAVLMALYYLAGLKQPANWRRPLTAPENWCALLPLACVSVYITGSSQSGGAFDLALSQGVGVFLVVILLGFFLLWGVVFAASRHAVKSAAPFLGGLQRVFMLSAVFVPAFYWLESLDLQKNASHPAVFILMLATIRLLEAACAADARRGLRNFAGAAIFLLLVGAWTPIVEINRSLHGIHQRGSWYQEIRPNTIHNDYFGDTHVFFGKLDSPFYRYLARRVE